MIATLAFLNDVMEIAVNYMNYARKTWLVPLVLRGGRDMVLLKGGWIDKSMVANLDLVEWTYDSTRHHVLHHDGSGRIQRWKWLGAGEATDFFTGLRVSADHTLSDRDAIMLYAHQSGRLPGLLPLTMRDGSESTIDVNTLFRC
jgi:hypothetical protein